MTQPVFGPVATSRDLEALRYDLEQMIDNVTRELRLANARLNDQRQLILELELRIKTLEQHCFAQQSRKLTDLPRPCGNVLGQRK
jgi:hypothetical protein